MIRFSTCSNSVPACGCSLKRRGTYLVVRLWFVETINDSIQADILLIVGDGKCHVVWMPHELTEVTYIQ